MSWRIVHQGREVEFRRPCAECFELLDVLAWADTQDPRRLVCTGCHRRNTEAGPMVAVDSEIKE
jgi:hypothetical protein